MDNWSPRSLSFLLAILLFGSTVSAAQDAHLKGLHVELTMEERDYLKRNSAFTVCEQFDIYPLSGVKDGQMVGMRGEYVDEIVRRTGLRLKIIGSNSMADLKQKVQNGECDIIGSLGSNQKVFPTVINTDTVMEFPYGVMGDLQSLNIAPYTDLSDYTFIVRFNNIRKTILKSYPELNIEVINDIDTAIKQVSGKVHFVALKPVTERVIQQYGFKKYKLNGVLDKAKQKSTMGVHIDHPMLLTIINKAIQTIEPRFLDQIFDKYSIKEFKLVQSFAWLWYVAGGLLGLLIVFQYLYLRTRKESVQKTTALANKFSKLFEVAPTGYVLLNQQLQVLECNKVANQIVGSDSDDHFERDFSDCFGSFEEKDKLTDWLKSSQAKPIDLKKSRYPEQWISLNKETVDEPGEDLVLLSLLDVTDRVVATKGLAKLANYDSLTCLPNRHLFNEVVTQNIARAKRDNSEFWVMFLDLDGFKEVNDSLGHKKGDELLVQISNRLTSQLRSSDFVARLGGDEFVIIVTDRSTPQHIEQIATTLIDLIAKPFQLAQHEVSITTSIGITNYPRDAKSFDDLLIMADQSMYAAKNCGKNQFTFFTKALQYAAELRHQISNDLDKALANDEFELYYQPIVSLNGTKTNKAEALVRWKHPQKGIIPPAAFIPLSEETGRILAIGSWIFRTALVQLDHWQKTYDSQFQLSINKSPLQLKNKNRSPNDWTKQYEALDLTWGSVILEITESVIVKPEEHVNQRLQQFSHLGIDVAIDDFGTGYSSLAYLNEFDIGFLKIDKSFTSGLGKGESRTEAVCEAIIVMAHKLSMKVIAEGVESEEQLNWLKSHDCDFGQGYHFSRPIPAKQYEREFLQGNHSAGSQFLH